ncbi:MAG TPA: hypothetical protein VGB24_08665 [Longimicrobium sp.]|uniref:hypothetical protein n=1 Tax=Longimicrobium sp. TaxID=2029185 RepID=UPI002EDA47E7
MRLRFWLRSLCAPDSVRGTRRTHRRDAEEQRLRAESEAVRRREAEVAVRRARFLSQVSATLAGSLEPSATLARLARLAVPELGDWCVIDLRESDEWLRRVAAVHHNREKEPIAAILAERYSPRRTIHSPPPRPCAPAAPCCTRRWTTTRWSASPATPSTGS